MPLIPITPHDQEILRIWELYRQGMYHLSMGNFAEGWRLFDERIRLYPQSLQACLTLTPDDPAAFTGKRITIIADPDWKPIINGAPQDDYRIIMGGYEILFFQYIAKLLEFNPAIVRIIVDPRLVSLFIRSLPDIEIIARADETEQICRQILPASDIVIPLASIGKALIHSQNDIPYAKGPWLKTDFETTSNLRLAIDQKRGERIPLAFAFWGAGIRGKSIPPEDFLRPFAGLTDKFFFVNTQGFPAGDTQRSTNLTQAFKAIIGEGNYMLSPVDLWNGIDGTASLLQAIKELQGIAVMIPNYTEMILCGIGLPNFKPLHGDGHFRYGAGRAWTEDWFIYPTTQTFLQDESGEWSGPLTRIAKALADYVPGEISAMPIRHDPMQFKPASVDEFG